MATGHVEYLNPLLVLNLLLELVLQLRSLLLLCGNLLGLHVGLVTPEVYLQCMEVLSQGTNPSSTERTQHDRLASVMYVYYTLHVPERPAVPCSWSQNSRCGQTTAYHLPWHLQDITRKNPSDVKLLTTPDSNTVQAW